MRTYLSFVKFSHTVFALPFALVGYFLAVQQPDVHFSWTTLLLVLACMVFARNAAMGFNRYLDRDIDQLNPRTASREVPAGKITPAAALIFVLANVALFIFTTWWINMRVFLLSPVAMSVILGYSYTKRFTPLCHLVLGVGLGLAPIGAYLAAGGGFDAIPVILSVAVATWVAGFDIIYALQDVDFDQSQALHSIPTAVGKGSALHISEVLHVVTAIALMLAVNEMTQTVTLFGGLSWLSAVLFVAMLFYQHILVKPYDLSRVDRAFFTTNGLASVVFGALVLLDIWI